MPLHADQLLVLALHLQHPPPQLLHLGLQPGVPAPAPAQLVPQFLQLLLGAPPLDVLAGQRGGRGLLLLVALGRQVAQFGLQAEHLELLLLQAGGGGGQLPVVLGAGRCELGRGRGLAGQLLGEALLLVDNQQREGLELGELLLEVGHLLVVLLLLTLLVGLLLVQQELQPGGAEEEPLGALFQFCYIYI